MADSIYLVLDEKTNTQKTTLVEIVRADGRSVSVGRRIIGKDDLTYLQISWQDIVDLK